MKEHTCAHIPWNLIVSIGREYTADPVYIYRIGLQQMAIIFFYFCRATENWLVLFDVSVICQVGCLLCQIISPHDSPSVCIGSEVVILYILIINACNPLTCYIAKCT